MNTNLVIPGGRSLQMSNNLSAFSFKTLAQTTVSTFGSDCLLYILCRTFDSQEDLNSISRLSNKVVALTVGLTMSDYLSNKDNDVLNDTDVYSVVNNSTLFCPTIQCSILSLFNSNWAPAYRYSTRIFVDRVGQKLNLQVFLREFCIWSKLLKISYFCNIPLSAW